MNAPCKDCEDRHNLCHSSCEKYRAFRDERERIAKGREREQIGYDCSWYRKRKGR